ncbi:hypothetical protein LOTGIDRAFT_234300 [Lottia gigantea]|uniref:Uncharacterized protein n=1 Tax=Lottia gigantea TaxID=225164 RepID=V3ZYJ7_LOTGI|nr:hypothetical protein LOTGIDRAFT_234300 [Lottia gigantea]ESO89457.1 hypothetical protein LOTGIDRAFT_234300 [Lottia gigantea]
MSSKGGYPQQGHGGQVNPPQGQQASVVVVNRPNAHLGFAIFTCLCCFFPTGIVAIIFACMSQSSSDRNDFTKAQEEGNLAKILSIISLVIGLIWIIAVIIYVIVFFVVLADAVSTVVTATNSG